MITYKICKTDEELLQILALQEKNLPIVLSENEKEKEGFVTVHHTFEVLKKMKPSVIPPFSSIITEVNVLNTRSLNAHFGIGFKEFNRFTFAGQEWVLIEMS